MSVGAKSNNKWKAGISDYTSEGVEGSYAFGRSIDHRTDPRAITLLPRTVKESGTVVTDLPKAGVIVGTDTYMVGDTGNFYKRTTAGSYSLLRSIAGSHGNGLSYFAEDDFIYYPTDKSIGRYGPISGTPTFVDDFLTAQGGVPTNTNSIDLEASSSMYASRADTASLSITGDLTLEVQIKPESLPAVGDTMTLVSKWDETGATRSYKWDIAAVSGYFGDGTDGALTISSDTTEAPIDSACTGTAGTQSLSATNVNFATGQVILIHQSQGTGAGTWERNKISSYTAGTISLESALSATYITGAQVRVLKQYSAVTINSGKTYTAKAWNGTVGGILAFLCSGTVTVTGTISANGGVGAVQNPSGGSGAASGGTGGGFRGGATAASGGTSYQGEGTAGTSSASSSVNGNGGAGGYTSGGDSCGGAGGGNATAGSVGTDGDTGYTVPGGLIAGTADLTTLVFGGGGGGGASQNSQSNERGGGGSGGGIVFLTGTTVTITGAVTSSGGNGGDGYWDGGGGAGGSILIKAQTATLGTTLITANGGVGGGTSVGSKHGGNGGNGRVHLDYYTSYTGTTTPTLDVLQDNNLVTTTTYQARLAVSTDGTALETLTKEFTPVIASWQHVAVSWDASASLATFYFNGASIGTRTGALTAIHNNASTFQIGMYENATVPVGFYDGLMDEVRVWNLVRSDAQILGNINDHVLTTSAGLQAYYKLNGGVTDSTANANDLTASGSPTYSTDVPFSGATTRLDIDQSATTTTNAYTMITAINEAAAHRKTFTPAKDPQKSIAVLVASVGTGDWTLTVHDSLNNLIASKTILAALMGTGYQEFIFASVWRPIINADYHFHLTSTVADGTVTCTTTNDLTTVSYRTYFQFLVEDSNFHLVTTFLNFLVVLNERYLAKYEATLYTPNHITFPAGWTARSYGFWREYIAIGMIKGATITASDQGRIYFWDGIAPTFNFFIDVPEGGIDALLGTRGLLSVWAGYQGDRLIYKGGDSAEKINRVPKMTDDTNIEIYPNAVSMWKTLLRIGVAGGGTSTEVERGVYSWGSVNVKYPEALTYDYPISTGTRTSAGVKIGLLLPVNQKLLIGWKDGIACGVDYVSAENDPYPTGTCEFLDDDDEFPWKQKLGNTLVATFEELASGESINLGYKLDDETNWTELGSVTTAGETIARLPLGGKRYKLAKYKVDLATTTTTSPKVVDVSWERDLLEGEKIVG